MLLVMLLMRGRVLYPFLLVHALRRRERVVTEVAALGLILIFDCHAADL